MSIQVVSHSAVQRRIPDHHTSKNAKRTPRTISRTRWKKKAVLRVDRKPEPGVQIQIGTSYQTERDEEVVGRFTQTTMTMSLPQSAQTHHTPGPGLQLLLLGEWCVQKGFLTAPSRQVCKVRICSNSSCNLYWLHWI